jgi:hypothetical protein
MIFANQFGSVQAQCAGKTPEDVLPVLQLNQAKSNATRHHGTITDTGGQ